MQYYLRNKDRINWFLYWFPDRHVKITQRDSSCLKAVKRKLALMLNADLFYYVWLALVIISIGLVLAIQPRYDMGDTAFTVLFSLECVCQTFFLFRMVAVFIVMDVRMFLNFWEVVDSILNAFCIASLAVTSVQPNKVWLRCFYAGRAVRHFAYAPLTQTLAVVSARTFPFMADIVASFVIVVFFFCSIAVVAVGNSVNRGCFITFSSGSRYDNVTMPFLIHRDSEFATCGDGLSCPDLGPGVVVECLPHTRVPFKNYKNIGTAFLIALKLGTGDDNSHDYHDIMVAKGSGAAVLLVCISTCALLFYAVVNAVFFHVYSYYRIFPNLRDRSRANRLNENGSGRDSFSDFATRSRTNSAAGVGGHLLHGRSVGTQTIAVSRANRAALNRRNSNSSGFGSPTGHPSTAGNTEHSSADIDAAGSEIEDNYSEVVSELSFYSPYSGAFGAAGSTVVSQQLPAPLLGVHALRGELQYLYFQLAGHVAGHLRWSNSFSRTALGSPWVHCLFFVLTVANTVLIAVLNVDFPEPLVRKLMIASSAISCVFILPAAMKLICCGLRFVVLDATSWFDLFAVASGIIELAAPSIFSIRVVRGLRSLRVLRLWSYATAFHRCCCHLSDIIGSFVLLFVVLLLYAFIGMQLFDTRFVPGYAVGQSFDTMWDALLLCFSTFTGDGWYWRMIIAFNDGRIAPAAIFFVTLITFSYLILNPLILSVMVYGWKRFRDEQHAVASVYSPPVPLLPMRETVVYTKTEDEASDSAKEVAPTADVIDDGVTRDPFFLLRFQRRVRPTLRGSSFALFSSSNRLRKAAAKTLLSDAYRAALIVVVLFGFVMLFFERHSWGLQEADKAEGDPSALPSGTKSMDTRKRMLFVGNIVYVVIMWVDMFVKWFTYGVVNWQEEYISGDGEQNGGVGGRFVGRSHSYRSSRTAVSGWRRFWSLNRGGLDPYFLYPQNYLDFAANILGFAGIFCSPLRLGRLLHLLRLFTTQEAPNFYMITLLKSLANLQRALPLVAFLFIFFSVLGVQLFSGVMGYCSDPTILDRAECTGRYNVTLPLPSSSHRVVNGTTRPPSGGSGQLETTVEVERHWLLLQLRYDNFGQSLLTVLAVATSRQWTQIMQRGLDVVNHQPPSANGHPSYFAIYFVFIVIFFRLYAFNVAVAAIGGKLESRERTRETRGVGDKVPEDHQRSWRSTIYYVAFLSGERRPLPNKISRAVHQFLARRLFEQLPGSIVYYVVLIVAIVHSGFVVGQHSQLQSWEDTMFRAIDIVGVVVYGVELILKLTAYGWRLFFRFSNLLNLIILVLLIVSLSVAEVRFLNAFVLLKIISMSFMSFSYWLSRKNIMLLLNALFLYLWVLLTYAVVGVQLFGDISVQIPRVIGMPRGPNTSLATAYGQPRGEPVELTLKYNFSTVVAALLVMFDCSTSDQWVYVMWSCSQTRAVTGCTNCGHSGISIPYFVTFQLIMYFCIRPMLMAAVLEAFRPFLSGNKVVHAFFRLRHFWEQEAGDTTAPLHIQRLIAGIYSIPPILTGISSTYAMSDVDVIHFLSSIRLWIDPATCRTTYRGLVDGFYWKLFHEPLSKPQQRHRTSYTAVQYYVDLIRRNYYDGMARANEHDALNDVQLTSDEKHMRNAMPALYEDNLQPRATDIVPPAGSHPIPNSKLFIYNVDALGGTDKEAESAHEDSVEVPDDPNAVKR